jgi:hypothetical protein
VVVLPAVLAVLAVPVTQEAETPTKMRQMENNSGKKVEITMFCPLCFFWGFFTL